MGSLPWSLGDSQIFWDPYCTHSGWYGVTSVVIGGLSDLLGPILYALGLLWGHFRGHWGTLRSSGTHIVRTRAAMGSLPWSLGDSQIFWDPYCTHSGWHGVTSVVIG